MKEGRIVVETTKLLLGQRPKHTTTILPSSSSRKMAKFLTAAQWISRTERQWRWGTKPSSTRIHTSLIEFSKLFDENIFLSHPSFSLSKLELVFIYISGIIFASRELASLAISTVSWYLSGDARKKSYRTCGKLSLVPQPTIANHLPTATTTTFSLLIPEQARRENVRWNVDFFRSNLDYWLNKEREREGGSEFSLWINRRGEEKNEWMKTNTQQLRGRKKNVNSNQFCSDSETPELAHSIRPSVLCWLNVEWLLARAHPAFFVWRVLAVCVF